MNESKIDKWTNEQSRKYIYIYQFLSASTNMVVSCPFPFTWTEALFEKAILSPHAACTASVTCSEEHGGKNNKYNIINMKKKKIKVEKVEKNQ